IKAFTAEDAMVIVGTVIDDAMEDRLRVTMVATGLGGAGAKLRAPRLEIVEQVFERTGTDGMGGSEAGEYDGLGRSPAVIRVGLHTGARVDLTLRPAPPDSGIVFHRVDLAQSVAIPALAANVGDTRLSSSLEKDGVKISTVEHLMSALAGLGIDNLHVDVAGPEIPIMDGSAGPFVFLLQSAGIAEQAALKRYLRIKAPVEVRDRDKRARFEPFDSYRRHFTIDFPHPVFGSENRQVVVDFAGTSYV